jgi:hypothetical protein
MKTLSLLGTTLGFAFAAGLNLYATVVVIGIAIRFHLVTLPAPLAGLDVLAQPLVLAAAAALYVVEFLADKVPAVDHVWDAIHTFVRPAGAAWIAWRTVGGAGLSEPVEVVLLLAAGGVALSTHAGKAGTRLAAGSVGGHFFGLGIALSLIEDLIAFVVTPLALLKPILMLVFVLVALVCLALAVRPIVRAIRRRRRPAQPLA